MIYAKPLIAFKKRIVAVFLDFKADLTYRMEIPTLLVDRQFPFEFSYRKVKLVMIEASLGGRQFCFIFFFFMIVFNSKNIHFSSGLSKQNLPHFLTQFWFESPPDHAYLAALRKKEDMVMNGRFEFREENMTINAIILTLISRK